MVKLDCQYKTIKYAFEGVWNASSFFVITLITSFVPTLILVKNILDGAYPDLTMYITLLTNALPHARLFLMMAINKEDVVLSRLFRFERVVGIFSSISIIIYCLSFFVVQSTDTEIVKEILKVFPDLIKYINCTVGLLLNVPFTISAIDTVCQLVEHSKKRNNWQKDIKDKQNQEEKKEQDTAKVARSQASNI